jgi:hypothetical protein
LTGGTTEDAFGIETELTGGTWLIACTTMGRVRLQIYTLVAFVGDGTDILALRTISAAQAFRADIARRALLVALTTVSSIGLNIDTYGFTVDFAIDLPFWTCWNTNAL